MARGAAGAYRVGRVVASDEPPESGPLFWEAAIGTADRGAVVERVAAPAGLAADPPMLAILPLRPYRPGGGSSPLFAEPLVCPSLLAPLVPNCEVAGLPAWRPEGPEPWIYDGRITARLRR